MTAALKAKGMYDNTLFVVTTDNGAGLDAVVHLFPSSSSDLIFSSLNLSGGPTHECAPIGAVNFPFRGGKCSLWEGGTRGTGFVYAPWLPKSGFTWNGETALALAQQAASHRLSNPHLPFHFPPCRSQQGLMHAVDWLPTLVEGVVRQGQPLPANSTLPLDGVNVWAAMTTNATSPRGDLYYGVADPSVGKHGPALRLDNGWKLILNGSGGTGKIARQGGED